MGEVARRGGVGGGGSEYGNRHVISTLLMAFRKITK